MYYNLRQQKNNIDTPALLNNNLKHTVMLMNAK